MAARKKKAGKAKKKASPARKSKSVARKAAKRPAKKAKKASKKTAPKAVKRSVKAAVKRAPAPKAKKNAGEGDYAASRAFDKDQAGFVQKNKANIPALGKAAEAALDGPEGASLWDAEATAAARSRDNF